MVVLLIVTKTTKCLVNNFKVCVSPKQIDYGYMNTLIKMTNVL